MALLYTKLTKCPLVQYDAYKSLPSQAATPTPEQSQAPEIPQVAVPPPQIPIVQDEPAISGAPPPPGHSIVAREEHIEYRDQHGNILNEEQVKALEGKVEFKTRYETRTRLVDANGNEIPQPDQEEPAIAPPHPDVQGMALPPNAFFKCATDWFLLQAWIARPPSAV